MRRLTGPISTTTWAALRATGMGASGSSPARAKARSTRRLAQSGLTTPPITTATNGSVPSSCPSRKICSTICPPWPLIAPSTHPRQDRHLVTARRGNDSLDTVRDPFDNDVYVSRLEFPAGPVTLSLAPAKETPLADAKPSAATIKERAEVERCRA